MWIVLLVALLLAAQLSLTALVPLQPGGAPPPWWVGGMVVWPFSLQTRTLLPPGDLLNTLTPVLGILAGAAFLAAAAALLGWWVPASWLPWLIVAGAAASIVLHVVWISPWAILPLLLNVALLWAVFGMRISVATLRG